jgi:hypothetical protein
MLRRSGKSSYLPSSRVVVIENKAAPRQAMQDEPEPQVPEDLAPPGMRVLAASFRKDGTRYRPGERLEKQARKWAASGGCTQSAGYRADNVQSSWSRSDAKETLAWLMAEMVL